MSNNTFSRVSLTFMTRLSLILFIVLSVRLIGSAETKVVAHRGYWDSPGASQNSIAALHKADSIGCHAVELDVWMTADSVLVVNHDPWFNGVDIQTSLAKDITSQHLSNGESLPTLREYLQAAHPLKVRLVIELKTHDSRAREILAADKLLAMINEFGLDNRTDYIAFSKEAFARFIKKAPEVSGSYYLNGDYLPEQILFLKGKGIDYSFSTLKKHPEWIDRCHDLGLEVNVWTVNNPDDIRWCLDRNVDFITTNAPELVQRMIQD